VIQPASDLHTAFLRAIAKSAFRASGLQYREAAARLKCSYPHLFYVLSGKRESITLLTRVLTLPPALP